MCVWSPYYGYAIDKVESVQQRFTKRLHGFHRGTKNAGVENAGVEISARSSRKRQGVKNAGVEKSAR